MWLHAVDAAPADDVVVVAAVAEVVDDEVEDDEEVDEEWWVVVVDPSPLGEPLLLQAAKRRPAPATNASARKGAVTPRSLPAAPNRGTGGIGRPVRPVCPPPLHRCRGRG